jgi:serine/threonine protein kinase
MADVLKKFGRYFLLDQIAQGGMAEIYRARLAVTDGAGRLIVIKRIQSGFGGNNDFLQMFRSEIKVTMGFNHPNIVQLYDFGEEQRQPYIAMELVDGKNLRQYMNRFNELKQSLPPFLAAYIIEQAASGLHYAHAFKDKISGESLNIVHRDISPQNILISYEGTVKVIDFGIAKATTNMESTRAGVIKGKPSYLSPEQIYGEPLDGRSDLFALGIVLWELLVGRKLFAGDNELAVLKLIESSQTHVKPPSTFNPAVPPDLDAIVMKSLTKQKDKRYQTAEEMQRALHRFLYSNCPDFNPTDLSYTAKDLFKNEIVEDRKRIQRLNEEVEKILVAEQLVIHHELQHVFENEDETTPGDHTTTVVERKKSSVGEEVFEPTELKATGVQIEQPQHVKIPSRPIPPRPDNKPAENKVELRSSPQPIVLQNQGQNQKANAVLPPIPSKSAPIELDKSNLSTPVLRRPREYQQPSRPAPRANNESWRKPFFSGVAAVLVLSIFGPSFGVTVPILSPMFHDIARVPGSVPTNNNTANTSSVADPVAATAAGQKQVTLHLNVTPQGAPGIAKVNGHLVKLNSGNGQSQTIVVPTDAPLELLVDDPGYKTITRDFVIESAQLNGQKDYTLDVQLEATHSGYLTIKTTPSADAVISSKDGKTWKMRTPFERESLPAGTYSIKLRNDLLDMERVLTVQVKEGETSQPFDDETSRELKLGIVPHKTE